MLTIDYATLDDHSAITELHVRNWQVMYCNDLSEQYLTHDIHQDRFQTWYSRLTQPMSKRHILVAKQNGQMCGFICIELDAHPELGTLVDNLHVNPEIKGQGIGKQLLAAAKEIMTKHAQSDSLYLEVLASNLPAIGFYQRMGGTEYCAQTWQAPDGTVVDEYIYHWPRREHITF
ncbi:GNAT family N-acetyltransferase [Photobacterium halotolerans]|uniref:GNAT family N-acetyltransferase n=1 Tax=Photobacterium halotolerans TaxID=265726 RepID=UPI00137319D9|nr:GNAT family N-acetyltransferase [Photobacterium halotolerans]NAX46163.1 GNAT family N-acetyltransferase [Photobacterium halotolerans]